MLILADWVVPSVDEPPLRNGGLRIVADRITAIGDGAALAAAHPGDEVHDATGHAVVAGFVNSHMHAYGVLAHGIPLDAAPTGFWNFLADFWWPMVEDALDHEMIAAATDWACTEMLQTGTTTFFDVLEAPAALPGALGVEAEIVERRGLRGILSFEATERAGPAVAAASLEENARHVDDCAGDGLVGGAVSFHTTFTCSAGFIRHAFDLAADREVLCHAHCNEGVHEPERAVATYGKRTFEYYEDLGVVSPRFLASQCVQLSEREREIIAAGGVRCSHMPLSNGEVGAGIAPVPELLAAGVTVGLGTDGYVNDMYEVMRAAFVVHKARLLDPATMPASVVFDMATRMGAAAIGRNDIGVLAPGYRADLQVVDAAFPTPATRDNLIDQLVLWRNGSHVRDVMVDGRWRVLSGAVVDADIERQRAAVHAQAHRLWPG